MSSNTKLLITAFGFLLVGIILVKLFVKIFVKISSVKKFDLLNLNLPDFINKEQEPIFSINCAVWTDSWHATYPLGNFVVFKDFLLIWVAGTKKNIVILKNEINFVKTSKSEGLKIYHNSQKSFKELTIVPWKKDIPKVIEILKSVGIEIDVSEQKPEREANSNKK